MQPAAVSDQILGEVVVLAAERTQIGYQIRRQICPFGSLQTVKQGDPVGVHPVIFHFSDIDVFQDIRNTLFSIFYNQKLKNVHNVR